VVAEKKMTVIPFEKLAGWRPARAAYGVAGWPVAHSLSPAMQAAGLEAMGVEADYFAFEVRPEDLEGALKLLQGAGVRGLNLTVPHKAAAAKLVDELSEEARQIGVVNTLVFGDDGRRIGHNTDARGFSRALREEFRMPLSELRVLLLGAGGAARAIALQAARERAERIVIANRTIERAQELARQIAPMYLDDKLERQSARLRAVGLDAAALAAEVEQVDLIVNATSLGLRAGDAPPVPGHLLRPHHLIYDTIYNPARTPLIEAAVEAGARACNGLSMLLHQGALSIEIWLGRAAPVEVMRRALWKAAG
jgi:shikimate dehydrogenase